MSECYEPRGAARELFRCKAAEVLIEGPAGTGKTRAVLEKLHALCLLYPGSRHLALAKFRASLSQTVLVTWEDKVLTRSHPLVVSGAKRELRHSYEFDNGSEFVCGGIDRAERYMSGEFDTVTLFEGTTGADEDEWETALTRLRNNRMPYQQGIVDCNPGPPGHWINRRAERGMVRLRSVHADNPSLTPEYLQRLSAMTGVRRARYFLGQWVGSEGLVYDAFELGRHIRPAPASGRVVLGIDDGTHNPFACLRLVIDGDGIAHVAGERYRAGLLEQAKVAAVRELAADHEQARVDPSAAGLKLALSTAGLRVLDANNDVLAGIGWVQQRFGSGRLFIDPSCTNLIRELQTYEWADNAKKDVPVKEHDHACDALRYAIAALDGLEGTRVYDSAAPEPQRKADTPADRADAFQRAAMAALLADDD